MHLSHLHLLIVIVILFIIIPVVLLIYLFLNFITQADILVHFEAIFTVSRNLGLWISRYFISISVSITSFYLSFLLFILVFDRKIHHLRKYHPLFQLSLFSLPSSTSRQRYSLLSNPQIFPTSPVPRQIFFTTFISYLEAFTPNQTTSFTYYIVHWVQTIFIRTFLNLFHNQIFCWVGLDQVQVIFSKYRTTVEVSFGFDRSKRHINQKYPNQHH